MNSCDEMKSFYILRENIKTLRSLRPNPAQEQLVVHYPRACFFLDFIYLEKMLETCALNDFS